MAGRFSVEAVFKAVDRVTAPITRMQNRVTKFTRSAQRGLRSVNRVLRKVVRGLKAGATAALKFGGTAIVAGVAAAAVAINKVADAADSLAKRTRRLKFPIKEFQEWQFVAEQSGLTTEEFDKSIEKFTKGVGEARAGTGTLITILKKSNPELLRQITNAKSSADAFELYLKAIQGTENQLDKTALATAAFGRTGAKFLNVTEQTTEAIQALRKEQRENGVITKQQAKFAEDYNDAVNSLKRSLFGMLQNIILPMLPAITKTVKAWREWVVSNKDLIKSKVTGFLRSMRDIATDLIERLGKLNETNNLMERFTDFVKLATKAFGFLAEHGGTILKVVAGVVALSVAMSVLTGVLTAVNIVMSANPVGLIVIGIAALIAIVAILIAKWGPIAEFFAGLWSDIASSFQPIIDKISEFIPDQIKAVWSPVFDFFVGLISAIVNSWINIGKAIFNLDPIALIMAWQPLVDFFSGIWNGIVESIQPAIDKVSEFIPDTVKAAWSPLVNFFSGLFSAIIDSWSNVIVAMLELDPSKLMAAWEPLGQFFSDLWDGILQGFKDVVGDILGIVSKVTNLGDTVSKTVSGLTSAASETAANVTQNVKSFFGIDSDDDQTAASKVEPQIITPQERVARTIDEQRTTSTAEVTIKDETGRAALTGGVLGQGVTLEPSGAF